MQKDCHFNLTYALAIKAGIPHSEAIKIAWADQYTDELTKPHLYEIQTQSDKLSNWSDRQVQVSVLIPFHFIPGDDKDNPWIVTRNSKRARALVAFALEDVFQFGISLHGLQDTYSHEGFSGWEEDANACCSWHYLETLIPNIGHADARVDPDIANIRWTDHRTDTEIDNPTKFLEAAKVVYEILCKYPVKNYGVTAIPWDELSADIFSILRMKSKGLKNSYDRRKEAFKLLSGNDVIRYSSVNKELEPLYKIDFVSAAIKHLAAAIRSFEDLPRH